MIAVAAAPSLPFSSTLIIVDIIIMVLIVIIMVLIINIMVLIIIMVLMTNARDDHGAYMV